MLKKLCDYENFLKKRIASGTSATDRELLSIARHIEFFQHERLVHELVMILFALLSVFGILFFTVFPGISVLCLDCLFLVLLVPYVRHYYGLENGVQRLYDLFSELERL